MTIERRRQIAIVLLCALVVGTWVFYGFELYNRQQRQQALNERQQALNEQQQALRVRIQELEARIAKEEKLRDQRK